jgi:hypothetical protein
LRSVYSCLWPEIKEKDGFADIEEFEQFARWLDKQVELGKAKKILVEDPVLGIIDGERYGERWYLHLKTDQKWSLQWPDGLARPVFVKVTWIYS